MRTVLSLADLSSEAVAWAPAQWTQECPSLQGPSPGTPLLTMDTGFFLALIPVWTQRSLFFFFFEAPEI